MACDESGWTTGRFESFGLNSVFQPIFSLAHKRVIGYEALVRVTDFNDRLVPPVEMFDRDMTDERHVFLDRLCRYVHVANYVTLQDNLNWLFLNISSKVVAGGLRMGRYFPDLLEEFSLPAHRVVIEVIEPPIED